MVESRCDQSNRRPWPECARSTFSVIPSTLWWAGAGRAAAADRDVEQQNGTRSGQTPKRVETSDTPGLLRKHASRLAAHASRVLPASRGQVISLHAIRRNGERDRRGLNHFRDPVRRAVHHFRRDFNHVPVFTALHHHRIQQFVRRHFVGQRWSPRARPPRGLIEFPVLIQQRIGVVRQIIAGEERDMPVQAE